MITPTLKRALVVLSLIAIPASALALEGLGPRVTVTGTVQEVHMTPKQEFDQVGAEVIIKAANGQIVTAIISADTVISGEGRMSRKLLTPANIQPGMQVRVRGWRLDTKSLNASLFILLNLSLNPTFSTNGTLQAVDLASGKITVLGQDGQSRQYTVTNETEVTINYSLHGVSALSLVGQQVLLTLNPENTSFVRIIRITGTEGIASPSNYR